MKQKNDKEKCRGVISIFLAIVLIPCMVFVCAFGDVSRVALSKSQAEGASDLALYSLMSNYDKDLVEFYGMMASCQKIETFYDNCEEYFVGMMDAEGLPDQAQTMISDYIHSLKTGSNQITDFLQVDITGETKITALDNSSLKGNAALIEDQIVEFMKYRGPVEIVERVVNRFKAMNIAKSVEDASEDEVIVEAKQEYAKAEGELLEAAYYSYVAICSYVDAQEKTKTPDFEKYKKLEEDLGKIKDDFKEVTRLITRYYSATDGIAEVAFPLFKLEDYANKRQPKDVGKETKVENETIYCIDKKKLDELFKDIDTYCTNVETAQQNIVTACQNIPAVDSSNDVNEAIYCMQIQNAVKSSDLTTMSSKGSELMERYAKLKAAQDCKPKPKDDDLPEDWEDQIKNQIKKIEDIQKKYYVLNVNNSYSKLISAYKKVASGSKENPGANDPGSVIYRVQHRFYGFDSKYLNRVTTIGDFLKAVRENMNPVIKDMEDQINRLNICINGKKNVELPDGSKHDVVSLKKLKELILKYKSARQSWGSAANSYTSDYAKKEQAEYAGEIKDENGNYDDKANVSAKISNELCEMGGEAVDELSARLTNIRDDIQTFKTALDGFTYGKSKVMGFSGREDAIKAGRTVVSSTQSISYRENDSLVDGYYSQLIAPSGEVYRQPTRNTAKNGNDPNLNNNPPELYKFMSIQFPKSKLKEIQDEIDENDKRNDEYKNKQEKAKKSAGKADDKYLLGIGSNLESCSNSEDVATAIGAVQGIVDSVKCLVDGHSDEIRDRLYVCEYAMDMFSYSSFNNEGQFKLKDGEPYEFENFQDKKFPNYDTWNMEGKDKPAQLNKVAATNYRNPALTLTNLPINSKTDQANLAEIEYILYGNTDIRKDLSKSYNSIFAIREAMNLVSGFQNFYSGHNLTADAIRTIANGVMLATSGVVPECLTKCVLIGLISTLESAKDMEILKAGIPVEFYKNDWKQWYYTLSGTKSASEGKNEEHKASKNGLFYSDYMYIFLMASSGKTSTYKGMLVRIGDLIQANMRLRTGDTGYDLEKARCYFKLTSTLRVKPLMLTLPMVDNTVGTTTADSVRNSTDWCTYKVEVVRGYS